MAAKTRRVAYVRLALAGILLVPVSWAMITRAQEPEARPVPATTTADAIRREIATQNERHEARVAELRALRERIANENTEAAKADAERVDQLIERERADHAARTALLRDVLTADPARDRAREGDIDRQWNSLAAGVRRLNQSYVVAPVVSDYAASGGSYYIDGVDRADHDAELRENPPRVVEPAPGQADGDGGDRVERRVWVRPETVRLPPPLYVGTDGVRTLPGWLYGLPDEYPNASATVIEQDAEVLRLRQSVRELEREVEQLRQQKGTTP